MACKSEQQNLWITGVSHLTVRKLKAVFKLFSVCRAGGQLLSQTVLGPFPAQNHGSKPTLPTFAITAFPTCTSKTQLTDPAALCANGRVCCSGEVQKVPLSLLVATVAEKRGKKRNVFNSIYYEGCSNGKYLKIQNKGR